MTCKVCKGNRWVKNGYRGLVRGRRMQRYKCMDCGTTTTDIKLVKGKK